MATDTTRRGRGRPRSTGNVVCDRCGRQVAKTRVTWPDGRICGICYTNATRTYGTCDECGQARLLPGRDGQRSLCRGCAEITTALDCTRCGREGERYRAGICARCALRDDLADLLTPSDAPPLPAAVKLIEALCSAGRPESIHTWKRNPVVRQALVDIGSGAITLDHDSFDAAHLGRAGAHLRELLIQHGLLPPRDPDLALFEAWLDTRLNQIDDPAVRKPIERFATWHHLERVRHKVRRGEPVAGATRTAKQEITVVGGFLNWLLSNKHRTISSCMQADVDEWLSTGPTTRTAIRTFTVWAGNNKVGPKLMVEHRQARSTRFLTNEERIHWLRTCLVEDPDTLGYRVAGVLLLLYAQPLVRVVRLTCPDVIDTGGELQVRLGKDPAPVPEPFAALVRMHLEHRPNMQTVNSSGNRWLFPGGLAGRHIAANTVMIRLRRLGIDLLGARNSSLRDLVRQVPPPIVAAQLGYSNQIVFRHAALAAEPLGRYAQTAAVHLQNI
jgi:hypothetical protein